MTIYLTWKKIDDREYDIENEAENRVNQSQEYRAKIHQNSPQDPILPSAHELGFDILAHKASAPAP